VSQPQSVHFDSSGVQSYLNLLQGVITRMAGNSANCKSLCITLVSAIAVVSVDKDKSAFVGVAIVPILLFFLLDAYYLGLEQGFRCTYNEFVKRVQDGVATNSDLFVLMPKRIVQRSQANGLTTKEIQKFNPVLGTLAAISSFAVYPFYLTLLVVLLSVRFLKF
jgi:hypothetical protein